VRASLRNTTVGPARGVPMRRALPEQVVVGQQ
jgi:hypothetical protein